MSSRREMVDFLLFRKTSLSAANGRPLVIYNSLYRYAGIIDTILVALQLPKCITLLPQEAKLLDVTNPELLFLSNTALGARSIQTRL
jgi:hypothetical protein